MNVLSFRRGRSAYQAIVVLSAGVALVIACGSSDNAPAGGAGPDGGSSTSTPPPGSGTGDAAPVDGAPTTPAGCVVNTCPTGVKCDPTLGCVDCVADADCAATGRDPFCVLGRCEACRTNADCGVAAPSCYPGDHQCHTKCGVDGGARCNNATPQCDATSGACVQCTAATDCKPAAPLCEPTTRTCVTCTQNSDCAAASPKCSPTRFTCVGCITSTDCPTGQRCNAAERCEPGCTADAQCATAAGKKCDLATGNCVECLAGPDCTGVTPTCAIDHRCVQCEKMSDCGDGGTPFCRDTRCIQCRNDNDCPGANGNCDVLAGTCK